MRHTQDGSFWRRRRLLAGGIALGLLGSLPLALPYGISIVARAPVLLRGITLTRETTTPTQTRLRVDICGPDVTQIPRNVPLTVGFETPLGPVQTTAEEGALALRTTTTAQQVTVALTREPFLPPGPWKVTLWLDVPPSPGRGHLRLGDAPAQPLPPLEQLTDPSVVVVGTRCDEAYAAFPRVWHPSP